MASNPACADGLSARKGNTHKNNELLHSLTHTMGTVASSSEAGYLAVGMDSHGHHHQTPPARAGTDDEVKTTSTRVDNDMEAVAAEAHSRLVARQHLVLAGRLVCAGTVLSMPRLAHLPVARRVVAQLLQQSGSTLHHACTALHTQLMKAATAVVPSVLEAHKSGTTDAAPTALVVEVSGGVRVARDDEFRAEWRAVQNKWRVKAWWMDVSHAGMDAKANDVFVLVASPSSLSATGLCMTLHEAAGLQQLGAARCRTLGISPKAQSAILGLHDAFDLLLPSTRSSNWWMQLSALCAHTAISSRASVVSHGSYVSACGRGDVGVGRRARARGVRIVHALLQRCKGVAQEAAAAAWHPVLDAEDDGSIHS